MAQIEWNLSLNKMVAKQGIKVRGSLLMEKKILKTWWGRATVNGSPFIDDHFLPLFPPFPNHFRRPAIITLQSNLFQGPLLVARWWWLSTHFAEIYNIETKFERPSSVQYSDCCWIMSLLWKTCIVLCQQQFGNIGFKQLLVASVRWKC